MSRKVKYDCEFKLLCIDEVLKKGYSTESVAKSKGCSETNLRKWVSFYKEYGVEGLLPKANQNYNSSFKLKVLRAIKKDSLSLSAACVMFNIPSQSTIVTWKKEYSKNGYLGLENKPKGRPAKMIIKRKKRKSDKPLTREEELLLEIESLRAENELLKVQCLSSSGRSQAKQKTQAIMELRHKYDLDLLLNRMNMARSSFYYHQERTKIKDKYQEIKELIRTIYDIHKGRLGYRRITLILKQKGIIINHKTVLRLMKLLSLKSVIRIKKYRSYKGEHGKIAPNILTRNFKALKPNQKWATDITEFNVSGKKLYLSPIIDLFNQEIVSYELSE